MKILPLIYIDGVPTFTDSRLENIYKRMVHDGSHKYMFFDGLVRSEWDFVNFIRQQPMVFVAYSDDELAGIYWINQIDYTSAQFHLCTCSNVWGRSEAISKKVIREIFKASRLETLLGYVPVFNGRTLNLGRKLGWHEVGRIPRIFWNTQHSIDGVLFFITREEA